METLAQPTTHRSGLAQVELARVELADELLANRLNWAGRLASAVNVLDVAMAWLDVRQRLERIRTLRGRVSGARGRGTTSRSG